MRAILDVNRALSLKLSTRLKKIEQMVSPGYDHVWDCCCDHGFIGAALLSRQAASKVHFVDIVPDLMSTVEKNLQRFYPEDQWEVHCLDVAKLPLNQYNGKHLVIIAGVGGDLMCDLVEAIHQNHQSNDFDLLLCPVNNPYTLRQKLREHHFGLKNEVLIEDNRRFYEIMHVTSTVGENGPVNAIGCKLWQSNTVEQTDLITRYIDKTVSHYRRLQRGSADNIETIIESYNAIVV